jgi:hypothetical protein
MSKFSKLSDMIAKNPKVTNPDAVAAKIGMNKLGKKAFEHKAQVGREKARKK